MPKTKKDRRYFEARLRSLKSWKRNSELTDEELEKELEEASKRHEP
jgi:hypothetical protein